MEQKQVVFTPFKKDDKFSYVARSPADNGQLNSLGNATSDLVQLAEQLAVNAQRLALHGYTPAYLGANADPELGDNLGIGEFEQLRLMPILDGFNIINYNNRGGQE